MFIKNRKQFFSQLKKNLKYHEHPITSDIRHPDNFFTFYFNYVK